MALPRPIRQLANKIFGKKPVNDNAENLTLTDAELKRALDPPVEPAHADALHGYVIPHPLRPLEKLDDAGTRDWVKRQNDRCDAYMQPHQARTKEFRDFLTKASGFADESIPSKAGDHWFSLYRDATTGQEVLRVRDAADGKPRVLIDPNTLAADGSTRLMAVSPSPDGRYVACAIAELGGENHQTLTVIEVETGETLDTITDLRYPDVVWNADSNGFKYSKPVYESAAFDAPITRLTVMEHELGAQTGDDSVVFDRPDIDRSAPAPLGICGDGRHDLIGMRVGTFQEMALYARHVGEEEEYRQIVPPGLTQCWPVAEEAGYLYAITTLDAPRGRLVKIDLDSPDPKKWETVIKEQDCTLQSAFFQNGKIFATCVHEADNELKIYDLKGAELGHVPVPPMSAVQCGGGDEDGFMLKISSYTAPPSLYRYDIADDKLSLVKQGKADEELKDCLVERIHATAEDGTKIPMTVIRRKDVELDGTAALKLWGYGGFNDAITPSFNAEICHWVREGGVYVVANLRGGSEFGEDWYNQGRLKHKENVFKDYTACARHLVDTKYTSSKRLVAKGYSNGGLVAAASMLKNPELFGAVVMTFPLLDMLRFDKYTIGRNWISDYGDPNKKDDFETLLAYSPVHNVKPGVKYPPVLVETGDHDDLVVPSHSYKFMAMLQAKGAGDNPALLRVHKNMGHRKQSTPQQVSAHAEMHAFTESVIGPIDQKKYKLSIKRQRGHGPKHG